MDVRHDSLNTNSGAIHGIYFKTVEDLPLGLDTVCDPTNSEPDTTYPNFDLGLGSLRIAFFYFDHYYYWSSITDNNGFESIANTVLGSDHYVEILYDVNKIRLLGTES